MNVEVFSWKEVEKGHLNDFINLLLKQSIDRVSSTYSDIHIIPEDCGFIRVEWEDVPWNKDYGGHWQYIKDDEEEVVMKYYYFPDNSSGLFSSEEEYKEALQDWLEEHKEEKWVKKELGWVSLKRQEEFEKTHSEKRQSK